MTLKQKDEPERKLAAILAADVVGFARMLGADEVGTLARLHAARREVIDPLLASHRGRIFKEMGDGLLAEFPSVVLALRAAVAVQLRLSAHRASSPADRRIVLRVGVHQGEVVVRGTDLLGDGVNVAARLEPLAEPGGICVSARVREDAAGKIILPFEDGGERQLKNIGQAIRVFFLRPGPRSGGPRSEGQRGESRTAQEAAATSDAAQSTMQAVLAAGLHSLVLLDPLQHGRALPLTRVPLTLGRMPPSEFVLPGEEVSRAHCRVELAGGAAVITDLHSLNGTFVDDRRIEGPTRLWPGAVIRVGPHTLRYQWQPPATDPEATIAGKRPADMV